MYNLTGEDKIPAEVEGLILNESGNAAFANDLQIYDATKVIEQVILNSFSLVAQIITTEVMIVENIR
jgi:hypothetical protein